MAAGRIPTFAALGGEYVGAVGNHARPNDKGESPQPGHGYFLACDLPWDLVEPAAVAYLVELLLSNAIVVSFLDTDRYNMFGSWECISTCCDIPADHIALYADVEHLLGRKDLSPEEIRWGAF